MEIPELGWNEHLRAEIVQVTDSWVVSVIRMAFNWRICLSRLDQWQWTYAAGWCYDGMEAAFTAAREWNPEVALAPVGYKKVAADERVHLFYCPCGGQAYTEADHDCPLKARVRA